jgi:hypothetical protein
MRAAVKVTLPKDSLHDWRSRWDAIYQFLEGWRGKPFRPAQSGQRIAEIEFALDVVLPPSVREWISFALAHEEIKDCFGLRDDLTIEHLVEHDAVTLLLQGEADYYWAVKTTQLALPDPSVGTYYLDHDFRDEADPARKRFVYGGDCAMHVSHFAFHYLLSYFTAAGGGFAVDEVSPAFDMAALARDLGEPSRFGPVEAFAGAEILVWRTLPGPAVLGGNVHVELRCETDVKHLPRSVQELLAHAHLFKGAVARPDVYERRKAGRPWWRRPFG